MVRMLKINEKKIEIDNKYFLAGVNIFGPARPSVMEVNSSEESEIKRGSVVLFDCDLFTIFEAPGEKEALDYYVDNFLEKRIDYLTYAQ